MHFACPGNCASLLSPVHVVVVAFVGRLEPLAISLSFRLLGTMTARPSPRKAAAVGVEPMGDFKW